MEEKISMNKLIANDIINQKMKRGRDIHQTFYLDEIINNYDEEIKKHIEENLDYITTDILQDFNVLEESDIYYDEDGRLKFNLVFCDYNLLDRLDKDIRKISKEKGAELDFVDISIIAYEFTSSVDYQIMLEDFIDNKLDMGKEL